ncbi:hypothetical protein ACYPKM_05605 [Pseudomonas aeruginosa]
MSNTQQSTVQKTASRRRSRDASSAETEALITGMLETIAKLSGESHPHMKMTTFRHIELAGAHLNNALKSERTPEPKPDDGTLDGREYAEICSFLNSQERFMLNYIVNRTADKSVPVEQISTDMNYLETGGLIRKENGRARITEKGLSVVQRWSQR